MKGASCEPPLLTDAAAADGVGNVDMGRLTAVAASIFDSSCRVASHHRRCTKLDAADDDQRITYTSLLFTYT